MIVAWKMLFVYYWVSLHGHGIAPELWESSMWVVVYVGSGHGGRSKSCQTQIQLSMVEFKLYWSFDIISKGYHSYLGNLALSY